MNAAAQTALVILASVIAALLMAQTILLLVFVVAFRNWSQRTESVINEISQNIEPVLRATKELLVEGRVRLTAITTSVGEITQMAKDQVTRLDGFLKDATESAQLQLIRLDHLVGDSVNKIETTLDSIQRGVLLPMREITALVAGVKTALDFFFRRHKSEAEPVPQDEELFI